MRIGVNRMGRAQQRYPAWALDLNFVAGEVDSRIVCSRPGAGLATRINELGQRETVLPDTPRIDYDPVTRACRGLLVEGQRTRLNLYALAPTQPETVTVAAIAHTLSWDGSGTITLSGAHSATVIGAGLYPARKEYTFTPAAGSLTLTYSGDCADVQLEAGLFASSPIRGEGAQVTRATDDVTIPGAGWLDTTQGMLLVEASLPAGAAAAGYNGYVASIFGATNSSISLIRFAGRVLNMTTLVSNSNQASLIAGAWVSSAPVLMAVAYQKNNYAVSFRGSVPLADTSANVPTMTNLRLGSSSSAGQTLFGHIRRVRYSRLRPDNAGLPGLTA